MPKSNLSSSRSATQTEKHQVGFEGSLHYYCGKSTVFCFAHLLFQGFNGYGTAYSCSRLLFYYLFFFSHLQWKESESTAKNPMIVAWFVIALKKYSQSSPDHSDQISCLTLVFFKFAFQTSGEQENGPGPAGPEYVNTLADLLSSAPLIVNGVHTCVLLACAL